jgi:hypothetical protein
MLNQYSILGLDWFLRLSLMVLLGVFWIYTLVLSRRAKAAGIDAKKNYFLSFSFFFLFYALNYVQTELGLAGVFNYPHLIPKGLPEAEFSINIGFSINPIDSDIFLFTFFFLGAVPLVLAIEKFLLMRKKLILTIVGIAALGLNVTTLLYVVLANPSFLPGDFPGSFHQVLLTIDVLASYLGLISIVLTILIIYIRIAVISSGNLKAVGFLMFLGFVFQVAALFLSSVNLGDFLLSGAEAGHIIGLAGFFLIFLGIIQMK